MKSISKKHPLIALILCFFCGFANAQTYYFTTFEQNTSIRLYTGCESKLCDRYSMTNWDSHFMQFAGWTGTPDAVTVNSFLNFRVIFPPGYDKNDNTKKYPVILMLHGAGESGRIWTGRYDYDPSDQRYDNNGHNLLHGGNEHRLAVQKDETDPTAFPGIVVFPQAPYNGSHGDITQETTLSQNEEFIVRFLEQQIVNVYHGDIDRIYMHGLSNGARCTWGLAIKRPDLFAAIHPMSGTPYSTAWAADKLVTMPIRLSQGGTDTNPNPVAGQLAVDAMNNAGGSAEMIYFPTLGHGTWVDTYKRADFFPWLLEKNKRNIHVFGGDPAICDGNNLRLGFSKGMTAYQWRRDGVNIPGATNWDYTTNIPGTYSVAFTRPNGTSDVSNDVEVTAITASDVKPTLTYNSTTASPYLPIGIGGAVNTVILTAEPGFPQYFFYRNGIQVQSGSSNTRQVSTGAGQPGDAGNYTVIVQTASGCLSQASDPITLYYFSPNNPPGLPSNITATGISPTETRLNWTDGSGEVRYEIWRRRFSGNGYSVINWKLSGYVSANETTFVDTGLSPGATYRYRVRAIGPEGTTQTGEIVRNPVTPDNIPPSPPLNLTASDITDTQVNLTWDAATDNHQVFKYQIFSGSTLVGTVSGQYQYTTANGGTDVFTPPPTFYTVTNLAPGSTYFFSVRALDFISPSTNDDNLRNYSPLSEVVEVTTQSAVNGLQFRYYTHSGLSGNNGTNASQLAEPYTTTNGPNFNFDDPGVSANGQLVQEGVVSNFDISGAFTYQNTGDPNNFVYAFDGYLQVPQAGNYQFWTRSDDGSRLYLDAGNDGTAELQINNDGAQGETNVGSSSIPLATGVRYKIRVTYFENGGGNALYVRYTYSSNGTPSNSYPGTGGNIPNSWLYQSGTIIFTYYLKADANGDDPTINTAWTTSATGMGGTTAPAGVFNADNTVFVLANLNNAHPTVTLNSAWTVDGEGSKVIVGDGTSITLNLDAAVNTAMEASNNVTINVNNASVPQFSTMHTTSTVNFNTLPTGGNLPGASYGNVSLSAGGQYNLPLSTTTVKGNLTIANGVTTTGVSQNLTTLRIGGDLTINNASGNPFPVAGGQQYSLVFSGGTTHTVNFTTPIDPNLFSIQTDFGDVVNFTGINGRTFTVGSSQGGGLVLKGGSTLNIGNNNLTVTGRGTINPNDGTGSLFMDGSNLTFNSTATQNSNLYFAENSRVANLTSSTPTNNRLSLLSNVDVDNLVTVSSGELNANEGNLTLRSVNDSGTGTARIGPLLNGARVSGEITMQRYMSGEGRIYRYISSPVAGVTVANLQEFFPITGNFNGASSGPGINSGNASMFYYNETLTPQYQQFPSIGGNTQETLERGVGYAPFIREASAPTVIEMVGEPHQGNIPFTITPGTGDAANGWNLLGNPYPAPIQWGGAGWTSSGVNTVAYIRENSSATTTAVRTFGVNWDGKIAPGQAFWVRTTNGSPSLTVGENAKSIVDGAFYREGTPINQVKITMTNATHKDATVIHFTENATASFDTELDGVKQDNTFFNLSSLTTDNKPMALNRTTRDYCSQEVKLRITNATAGSYNLEVTGVSSIISQDKVTFTDSFTQTEITVTDALNYPFSITADAASKADGRFTLRFEKPEVVLNQKLATEAACEQNSPMILVNNSQPGVTYQAFHNGVAVSEGVMSIGGSLQLPVNPALVGIGATEVNIKAGFANCNSYDLPMTIAVQRDTLIVPEVLTEGNKLVASTENAQYVWYFEGEELEGQNQRVLDSPVDGTYQVAVALGSCSKLSEPVVFIITSAETSLNQQRPYPNPTRDKVTVTLSRPILLSTIRTINILGQVVETPVQPVSEKSVEVNFSEVPAGLYMLYINGRHYRIIRE